MRPEMSKSFCSYFAMKCRFTYLDFVTFGVHYFEASHCGAHSETRETEEACCSSVRFLGPFLHARQDGSQSESENSK